MNKTIILIIGQFLIFLLVIIYAFLQKAEADIQRQNAMMYQAKSEQAEKRCEERIRELNEVKGDSATIKINSLSK
jgi:choline-glycine betaine transporter